jgi:hypothetical protein
MESHGLASQPTSRRERVAILLGGVVKMCRMPSARFPATEKSTRSGVTTAREVSDSIAL